MKIGLTRFVALVGLLFVVLGIRSAAAQVAVEKVIGGLNNPCGIAIQPETGTVFIADSGAGRIVCVMNNKLEDVVTGFPTEVYGPGPKYNIGPLGLVFLDKNTLVVGDGGLKDGQELIRVYHLPDPVIPPIQFEETKFKLGPLAEAKPVPGEGNFYGLTLTKNALFVTCNGDDSKGWIAKAEINGTKFGELRRFIATKEAVEVNAPVGITMGPNKEVVVGQMGKIDVPNDSLLSFYHGITGKLLLNQRTGLHDITALAFSPKNQLYALDFAWAKPEDGGLYQLVAQSIDGQQSTKAVHLTTLDKPTAMAFGRNNELYITVIGPRTDENPKSGELIKIAPGL